MKPLVHPLAACMLILALFGCDPGPSATVEDDAADRPRDTTVAGDPAPSTTPVMLMIDEQPREFPPARLLVETRNARTVALLLSDDPREAINDDYTGNGYHLEIPFDEPLDTLRNRVWEYQASTSAFDQDTPHGIFLEGNRKQLVPFDVKFRFDYPESGDTAVWISGMFVILEETPLGIRKPPPRMVTVNGRIPVAIP